MSLKVDAEWKEDCCGKMDFDGNIVTLSCRSYPRGGGVLASVGNGPLQGNEARPDVKPSANCAIILCHSGDEINLATASFEGETQEQVQKQVEGWAQARFDEIATLLKQHFQVQGKIEKLYLIEYHKGKPDYTLVEGTFSDKVKAEIVAHTLNADRWRGNRAEFEVRFQHYTVREMNVE